MKTPYYENMSVSPYLRFTTNNFMLAVPIARALRSIFKQ